MSHLIGRRNAREAYPSAARASIAALIPYNPAVPADWRPPTPATVATALDALAAKGIGGTAAFNAAWYAKTDIYWDPATGSDTASGDAGQPVKTMGEICKRYGTAILSPRIPDGQSVTIHQLSDQDLDADTYMVFPTLGTGSSLAIVAQNPQRGADFSPTSVTAAVKTAVGTRLSLNGNLPAGTAAGDTVVNVTKASRAIISKIDGSGNAVIVQPVTDATIFPIQPFPYPSEDNTWAATDTYQVFRPLLSNVQFVSSLGSFTSATFDKGTMWFQGLYVPDAALGSSGFTIIPFDGNVYFVNCMFDPFLNFDMNFGDAGSLIACLSTTTIFLEGWAACLATETLTSIWMQGVNNIVDVDSFCNGMRVQDLNNFIYSVGCGGILQVEGGGFATVWPNAGQPAIWGPCTINVRTNGTMFNQAGTFAANLLVNALWLDQAATGTSYAAGVWTDGIALTPANLDAHNGLQNPRTGSRYTNST